MDPRVMTGKPVLRGTRIPVELLVRMVAQGIPTDEILADYPKLEAADIQAALWYAVSVLNQEVGENYANWSRNPLASTRSVVSKPSVNRS